MDKTGEKLMNKINHRPHCRQEGRCIRCGRPICEGCNTEDNNGIYGICIACNAKDRKYKNDTILPFKSLFFNRKKVKRFYKTCNDDRTMAEYIQEEMEQEARDEFENEYYRDDRDYPYDEDDYFPLKP
jgi:hypothetical protein